MGIVLLICVHTNTHGGCLASRLVHVVYWFIETDPPLASSTKQRLSSIWGSNASQKRTEKNISSIMAAIFRLGLISRLHGKGHKGTFVFETCFLISRLTDRWRSATSLRSTGQKTLLDEIYRVCWGVLGHIYPWRCCS